MDTVAIVDNLEELVKSLDKDTFIYEFLLAYGISKTSVTRLQKGDFNLSKISGEVIYKNKIFFKTSTEGKLLSDIDDATHDGTILKHNPRFIIITDFKTIVAKDLKTKLNRDFSITELPKYFDFFLPLTGAEVYKSANDNKADRDAAYKLGQLYEVLVLDNPDYKTESHYLNLFLSRLLFCLFAEDTGIFEKESIFTETLSQHTADDGSDVHVFLQELFQKLNTANGNFLAWQEQFPYVNGGLFRETIVCPKFSATSRKILLECGTLDWSEINPDIFGSMIQAVADPEERSDLGMHYTSVPNILKLIRPLFLDELYDDFQKNYDNANNLQKLSNRLSKIKFFDPACGSGNFLIITYKEIRLLEIKIFKRLIELTKPGEKFYLYFTNIKLSQFYGIEIKDFAHEMAVLSLWLAEHQMNKVFDEMLEGHGQSKPILPLKQSGKIVCDNAARVNWKEVCPINPGDEVYILGNPPYLGARLQDENQKKDVAIVLNSIKGFNNLDYISIWLLKASKYVIGYNASCAFVSTNSICQGEQVSLLWPTILSKNIEISFAYHSFKWTNNAKGNAGVTVIILGLRNTSNKSKYIYSGQIKQEVKNINAYLLDGNSVFVIPRSKPLSKCFPEMNFGNMPNDNGFLLLNENERTDIISHDKRAAIYIKRFMGASEFLNGIKRYCLWIESNNIESSNKIKDIKERIERVRIARENSNRIATKKLAYIPYRFGEVRHIDSDSIIIPRHSSENREYIPIGFLNSDTIIADSAMAIYDAQPWLFGVLHSKMHMVWVDTVGGKLETRYRYSAKLCYNTFPFPDIKDKQKEILTQYVFDVLDERAKYPEKTMAWLYNPETMPQGLRQAHKNLDEAVERIYRLAPFNSDTERLEHLFKLYEEMIKKDTLFAKEKKRKTRKTK